MVRSVPGPLDILTGRRPIIGAANVAAALQGTMAIEMMKETLGKKQGGPL